ncbi:type IV pilus assembly protein PilM [Patescibacteria group bacterium]
MDYFGLDIGSQNIKITQLRKKNDSYSLVALGLSPVVKSLDSELEKDLLTIAETIKKLVRATKITTKNVVASLPEDKVFTQIVDFPPMGEKELASAIRWEAEQYVPIPLSEAVIDYQLFDEPSKGSNDRREIFLVATPKVLIGKYVKILEMAGLKPVALETEMIALSRCLTNVDSPCSMIIDLGARATDIALTNLGQVILTRSLPSAGETITRALVGALGLKEMQAEQYKRAYGVDESKLEGKIKEAMSPILEVVIEEIKKVISFAQSQQKCSQVEKIILTGGTAHLPQIVSLFAEKTGIEVQVGDPFSKIQGAQEIISRIEKGSTSLYPIAFGLAMKPL